ncbi:hypothetical protein AB0451_39850 [Streptomyces sp. NPDC052000]|uniref:hypothetical protein n=1 Tax=Streptomyces sp. NPDC052000 TaxID=3155676 RepID=UPI00344F8772
MKSSSSLFPRREVPCGGDDHGLACTEVAGQCLAPLEEVGHVVFTDANQGGRGQ